jgi:hypothetical protein
MADSITGQVNLTFQATETKALQLVSGNQDHTQKISPSFALTFGDADQGITKNYGLTGTIDAGDDLDINLQGALEDTFGDAVSFLKIRGFAVYNKSHLGTPVSTAVMHVGGGDGGVGTNALNGWITSSAADGSERVILPAKGLQVWTALQDGITIASGLGAILRLANVDGGSQVATYEIQFLGA